MRIHVRIFRSLLSCVLQFIAPSRPSSSTSTFHNLAGRPSSAFPGQSLESADHRPKFAAQPSAELVRMQTSNRRTATAPAYNDQQLNKMLPPKRELPFAKTGSKRPRAGSSERVPTQCIRPAPSTEHCMESDFTQGVHLFSERNTLQRHDSQISDSPSQSLVPTQPLPDASQISRMSPEPQSTQNTQLYPKPVSPMEHYPHASLITTTPTDPYAHGRQAHQASNLAEEHFSLYLTSPTPERIAFLENWMCELIEDDKFMALCQDVEATWRRFAFGIKK